MAFCALEDGRLVVGLVGRRPLGSEPSFALKLTGGPWAITLLPLFNLTTPEGSCEDKMGEELHAP